MAAGAAAESEAGKGAGETWRGGGEGLKEGWARGRGSGAVGETACATEVSWLC